ncbi:MAG: redox-regulated ATPase YchF [Proteobacteria bacterium]|nr:redox-regulated ATPase YchF [Pseudomonadota bacterium]
MKVGIIGLPQSGKMTLFQTLTGNKAPLGGINKPLPGTADIIDTRFDTLVDLYQPKKQVHARLDLVLLPKIEKETISNGDIFRDIADTDAICHLVRAFEDEAIYHVDGSVNPMRDIDMVNTELIMHDLIFIEKRLEKLEVSLKKLKDETQQKEFELLTKMKGHLENEKPLRLLELVPDEKILIRSYPFITRKQMIIVLNIEEDQIDSTEFLDSLTDRCISEKMEAMQVSAQVESEIALLDTEEEKEEFRADMGIKEPALEILTGLCLKALGLISFFTVGKDEVRQWLLRKDSTAPEAAGVIHSDLQRGFIRAEVFTYDDLMVFKDEAGLKKAGKVNVNGKDYVVDDGDILNIRFKV